MDREKEVKVSIPEISIIHDKAIPYAKNPRWKYQDARGITHTGFFVRSTYFGGSDCPYTFIDAFTGEINVISGALLKKANRIWE